MTKENKVLMAEAREALKGKWKEAVGVYVIYMAISIVTSILGNAGMLVQLLIDGPLMVGLSLVSIYFARGHAVEIKDMFVGFNDFVRSFTAYILMWVFIILWTLLLIVPGIIAMYAYSLTFFILAEDKNISAREAIRKSKAMMYGHKKKMFYLSLRFFGWFLLCAVTFGIALLWVIPYMYVSFAKFYEDIVGKTPEVIPAPSA